MKKYRQCKLKQGDNTFTTCWVELKLAKVGKRVWIENKNNQWTILEIGDNQWTILEIGDNIIDKKHLDLISRVHVKHREVTDI